MDDTRASLLQKLGAGTADAWLELDRYYSPLIRNWLIRYKLPDSDVDDLTQDVMTVLAREISSFEHNGRPGAFRKWLRLITANRARTYLRSRAVRPTVPGSSDFRHMVAQLEDDSSRITKEFDREHDRFIITQLLNELSETMATSTLEAFRRSAIDEEDVRSVAEDLKMTPAAVYIARSRVMRALRSRAANLIDLP